MAGNIQIIFAKNPAEITNRRSALGSYIFVLSEILVEMGHKVRLNQHDFEDVRKNQHGGDPAQEPRASRPLPLPKYLKAWVRDTLLLRTYGELIKEIKLLPPPDVILEFYSFGSNVGLELSAHWDCPLKLVYDAPILEEYKIFQGFDSPRAGRIKKNQLETLQRATGIVAYSKPVKAYIGQLAGLPSDGHIKIHQNIDFSRFEFDDSPKEKDRTVIGFVGSFLKWHRVDLLVKVFERLRKEGHEAQLLLVGSGLEYEAIERQVAASPYTHDIQMTGFQDGEALFRHKQRMHIGVMASSNWYGAPNKLFEYGAMGMACVAPSTPTIADIFSEDQIYMFDNHSEEGLYLSLKKYLDHKESISQKGKNLQEFIRSSYGKEKTQFFYSDLLELDYQHVSPTAREQDPLKRS